MGPLLAFLWLFPFKSFSVSPAAASVALAATMAFAFLSSSRFCRISLINDFVLRSLAGPIFCTKWNVSVTPY